MSSKAVALLVEDDSALREMYADALKRHDFKVVECSTAEAADRIVATAGSELHALVTDNNLGGDMTRVELATNARGRLPNLNIVVMSGHHVPLLPTMSSSSENRFRPRSCWPQSKSKLARSRMLSM